LVVGLDIALEPFAAYVNRYWRWVDGAIPLENFASWAVLAVVFAVVLSRFMTVKAPYRTRRLAAVPGLILGLNLLQFLVVNLVHGYWLLSLGSIVVVAGVLIASARRGGYAV
ncbi:MAG: carotenoid biosynthesis protein, partial [Proteobacteria bacterium]|nr:carotenoid biosynthesis protein [Pseudomonadota bacterium]